MDQRHHHRDEPNASPRQRTAGRVRLGQLGLLALAPLVVLSLWAGRSPAAWVAPRAGLEGGASAIRVMNLNFEERVGDFQVAIRPVGGGAVHTVTIAGLPQYQTADVYLPDEVGPAPGVFAATVTGNQRRATFARTDRAGAFGVVASAGALPGRALLLAQVERQHAGRSTRVGVMNTAAVATTVRITAMAAGSTTPLASRDLALGAEAAAVLDLEVDPELALPDGFQGWLRLAADQPIAAAAETHPDGPGTEGGVASLEALPESDLAAELYTPLLYRRWGAAGLMSVITVTNPTTQTVQVDLTYRGIDGDCLGQEDPRPTALLGPGEMRGFASSANSLPDGCMHNGRLLASAPLLAVVGLTDSTGRVQGAYRALGYREANAQVGWPVLRKQHTAQNRLSSEVIVQLRNERGTHSGGVHLYFFDQEGVRIPCPPEACGQLGTIPEWHGRRLSLDQVSAFPVGSIWSILMEPRPSAAIVLVEHSATGRLDSLVTGANWTETRDRYYPLLYAGAGVAPWPTRVLSPTPTPLNTATATATATETASPTPTRSVQVVAVGYVDVFGAGDDPNCPGCNNIYEAADEAFARGHPLGPLHFTLRQNGGPLVATSESQATGQLQRAVFTVPELPVDESYFLELVDSPADWSLCPGSRASRLLPHHAFVDGVAHLPYYFNVNCALITPTATPGPGTAPVPTATAVPTWTITPGPSPTATYTLVPLVTETPTPVSPTPTGPTPTWVVTAVPRSMHLPFLQRHSVPGLPTREASAGGVARPRSGH